MSFLKNVLIVVVLRLGGFPALGQGTVYFANNVNFVTPGDDRLVRDVTGERLVGTNYFAQLYYGAHGASENDLVSVAYNPDRFRSPTTQAAGTWNPLPEFFRTLDGFVSGDTVSLQVRVWDSTVGATWEQASMTGFGASQYGSSTVFPYFIPPTGGPTSAYYMENFRGFMLVPEPSVIALAVLGAGGFLLFRRRK